MSYVQKTLSEKREYLVIQTRECREQIAQLEERGAAIQDEIAELQAAITDIDGVLASLALKASALKGLSVGYKIEGYNPELGPFKDGNCRPVDVYYNGV